ncbi:deoxyguanosinetriphosphate triphosphohydrolase family protein [Vibrio sp. ZSDZ34]|uniref:Deoxyguanosinetriphosphate triphosphohydrolase-like protein n=1 Tax=Vibrio gelatinilyticus TaxID=2893468 RepID=A0A9X1W7U5_9VIBR|nr:anti-phage deoxyguanosine triphosphatase [Vibrio gelatinilyticus]MCJ2375603.1 deoxyguanosinetriphosphate triphosphohydrolase family protein [Vibrio gelatinilyticus]
MELTNQETWQARHSDEHKLRRDDHRDPYQRDRARILHSAAFRRLQAKTQVHGAGGNDFHRTRLTHSLEAAQIGSGIVAQLHQKHSEFSPLLPSDSLIESLCLAHDIGHPPYGHGGEVALNFMMRDHGGFEGNGQTFRIVTQLEPYTESHGMNLTRRTLLGLLKYPAFISQTRAEQSPLPSQQRRQLKAKEWTPAKGIYDVDKPQLDWVFASLSGSDINALAQMRPSSNDPFKHKKTRYKSLDCSIMELADDIAYGVHDLEDAIVLKLVTRDQWDATAALELKSLTGCWLAQQIDSISAMLFSEKHYERKDAIGGIVNALLTSVQIHPEAHEFDEPLLRYNAYLSPEMTHVLNILKSFVSNYVIQVPRVQIFEYKGQQITMDLFEAFSADPERLLPDSTCKLWRDASDSAEEGMRVIADYISAMTDGYAQKMHQQLFAAHTSIG